MKKPSLALAGVVVSAPPLRPCRPPQPKIVVLDRAAIMQFSKVGQDIAKQMQALPTRPRPRSEQKAIEAEGHALQQQVAILAPDSAEEEAAFHAKGAVDARRSSAPNRSRAAFAQAADGPDAGPDPAGAGQGTRRQHGAGQAGGGLSSRTASTSRPTPSTGLTPRCRPQGLLGERCRRRRPRPAEEISRGDGRSALLRKSRAVHPGADLRKGGDGACRRAPMATAEIFDLADLEGAGPRHLTFFSGSREQTDAFAAAAPASAWCEGGGGRARRHDRAGRAVGRPGLRRHRRRFLSRTFPGAMARSPSPQARIGTDVTLRARRGDRAAAEIGEGTASAPAPSSARASPSVAIARSAAMSPSATPMSATR